MARPDKYTRLWNRRNPDDVISKALYESLTATSAQKDYQYMVDAMSPIDPKFTENTFAEGERIRNQLKENLPAERRAEFDYQGSVTNDTHIKMHSDIDLLALHGVFQTLDPGIPPPNPYPYAQSVEDLMTMRKEAGSILKLKFPEVSVDVAPGKSIRLEGGSLRRKIDVVIGNWWDTELWRQHNQKVVRGVNILNSKVPTTIMNKPFLHNYRIDEKDKATGTLRKVIRLLKTLKYDADPELEISSYDIAAVAWNMSPASLSVPENDYLQLARNARAELKRFIDSDAVRNFLDVPNATRKVFGTDGASLDQLRALHKELDELIGRIEYGTLLEKAHGRSLLTEGRLPTWKEVRPQVVQKHIF